MKQDDAGSAPMRGSQSPIAWAVFEEDGSLFNIYTEEQTARNVCSVWDVVPLYRAPTLTDEEREAIRWFADYGLPERPADTLRSLLERLG
jgi:hypothetical protein